MKTRLVIGKNASQLVIENFPQRVKKAYVATSFEFLKNSSFPVIETSVGKLQDLCQSSSHQKIVLEILDKEPLSLKAWLKESTTRSQDIVLALDGVQDPHNVGACMRAAHCLGASAIIWSKNRGPAVTPTVVKSSAGASECIDTLVVSNLAQALSQFKDAGYWVAVTSLGPNTQSVLEFDAPEKVVLVLGAEGEGVRAQTEKLADFNLMLPMSGYVDSLNVSQAAAVFLAFLSK